MPSLVELTAVVLCGGRGTRLRPVVSDQPKVLAKVNNVPYIYFLLDQIAEAGIKKVVLCTGYLGRLVKSTVGYKYNSLEILYSLEPTPMGTGGALRCSVKHICTNVAIVMNGDSFVECKFDDLFTFHRQHRATATIVLVRVPDVSRYGRVTIDRDNQIVEFSEKKEGGISESGLVNAGIYLIDRETICKIPKGVKYSLENEFFPDLVGDRLVGCKTEGKFIDIGTPESYKRAGSFFNKLIESNIS